LSSNLYGTGEYYPTARRGIVTGVLSLPIKLGAIKIII